MSNNIYRLKECALAMLCLSTVLLHGCMLSIPKLSKSDNTDIKKDKKDNPFVINNEFRNDNTTARHDMPSTKVNKAENEPSVVLERGFLSEWPTTGMKGVGRVEGQEILEKINNLEARLKEEEKERKEASIQMKKLNKTISDLQAAEAEAVAANPGSGYLSEGSTIRLGIIDGDEELKVLDKVKRLEARLEAEKNKVKALGKELTDLQAAKESVEKNFANTKKELEEKSNNLLKKINALESKLEKTESRAIAAERELNPVKKELLKTQISETKAQQELYKLKIENLKNDEE